MIFIKRYVQRLRQVDAKGCKLMKSDPLIDLQKLNTIFKVLFKNQFTEYKFHKTKISQKIIYSKKFLIAYNIRTFEK